MSTTPNPLLAALPPAIKPPSRARIYRIPNTSDHAVSFVQTQHGGGGGGGGGEAALQSAAMPKNNYDNNGTRIHRMSSTVDSSITAAPESFLWATREMAALDFLMNVPLNAEKDIVRAGLSEGRWQHSHHAHNARQQQQRQPRTLSNQSTNQKQHEICNEENKNWSMSQPHSRSLSAFDTRGDDEGGRMSETNTVITESSSLHAISLDNNKHPTTGTATVTAGGGRWWDKLILKDKRFFSVANQVLQQRQQIELEEKELERPTESPSLIMMSSNDGNVLNAQYCMGMATATAAGGVPGRRLDGIEAVTITIPTEFRRRPAPLRVAARQAAVREWEIRVAYGAPQQGAKQRSSQQQGMNAENHTTSSRQALLDGRVFFSTMKSYPVAVFSTIKYEPKKEETLRRRKQLEELGGGGTQFVLPERDWSESHTTRGGAECLLFLHIVSNL